MKIKIQKQAKNYRLTKGKFFSKNDDLKKCSGIVLIGIGSLLLIIKEYKGNPYTILRSWLKYQLPFLIKKNRKTFKRWVREVVLKKPIYYEYFSRDCDCYEVGGYSYADSRKEFNQTEQEMWESAEGECWMKRCSKGEYERNQDLRYERDRVMEGFENGDCYNI